MQSLEICYIALLSNHYGFWVNLGLSLTVQIKTIKLWGFYIRHTAAFEIKFGQTVCKIIRLLELYKSSCLTFVCCRIWMILIFLI